MMKVIAIDDEPIALDVVKKHADKVPFIHLNAVFVNAFDAVDYLQRERVDLMFLDIKMPDINGIDFLLGITEPPMVIFTTAYSEHAVRSFELDAIDYLLKPFSYERFLKSCQKAHELYTLRNRYSLPDEAAFIFVKDGYEKVKLLLSDILFIEAAGNYSQIRLVNESTISTRIPITEMQAMLPPGSFIRIHRTFIVASDRISRFDRLNVTLGRHVLPVGAKYASFLQYLL